MSGLVKAAGSASACATRTNTNLCLGSLLSLQSNLRLRDSSSSREGTPSGSRQVTPVVNGRQELDELPEGPLVTRKIVRCPVSDSQDSDLSQVKEAEYLMSFPVIGENGEERVEYMKNQLVELQESNSLAVKAKPVILMISLSGIKVCNSNGESVYMAHALKRISYATCCPDRCQFSFLAREPKAHGLVQYCHIFLTKTPDEASLLNSIVAQIFTTAYTNKRADGEPKPTLTFHDVIQNQIEACKEQFEEDSRAKQEMLTAKFSQISTPHVDQIAQLRKERRLKELDEMPDCKPVGDRSRLQSQLSGDNPTTGFLASQVKEALSLNLSSCLDADQPTLGSITRILEALNSPEVRTHGSPVTIIKDVIDTHFRNGLSHAFDRSPLNLFDDDPSPFSPITDPEKGFLHSTTPHANDGLNMISTRSSQKPMAQTSRCDPNSNLKRLTDQTRSQDQMRSKVMQMRESASSDVIQRATTSDVSRPRAKASDKRDDTAMRNEGPSDVGLSEAVWYKPGVAREVVLEMLSQQDPGSFIVRDSLTHPGCYALSIKLLQNHDGSGLSEIAHYLITRTSRGTYKLKGLSKEWNSLTALVTHHTVMREILPCVLNLPSSTPFKIQPHGGRHDQSQC